ncbi:hypothetical protein [Aerolutibacter ruishenii]|uniref:Uncharacterized protein n=1 Tax=Aerolutibacter ruishenii TaxID=686800 RepID=A0A562LP40_9GAMM|nr:hypothetical protein [Lysobacter ruishenii]TWI09394.1 hypothetical protein IP93_02010 [Lysobacter ruishenii]
MPPPATDLSTFVAAIAARDRLRHVALPMFVRRRLHAHPGQACPLCAAPYDLAQSRGARLPVVATLIHPALGGPTTPDNAFLCCRRCQQLRAAADLVASVAIPDPLRAQRTAVLLASHNHLLPLSPHTHPTDFAQALARRHHHPRSRVFAAQGEDGRCLIGVSSRFGDTQSTGLARLLARLAGAIVHQDHRLTIHHVEDKAFRTLVWQLIDANTLVVALAHLAQPRDFLDCWWITSASPSALRLRQVGITVPDPARSQSATTPHRLTAGARERLQAEHRVVRRQANILRQAINDQHKTHWLDGLEGNTQDEQRLLDGLLTAETQAAELHRQLKASRDALDPRRTARPLKRHRPWSP